MAQIAAQPLFPRGYYAGEAITKPAPRDNLDLRAVIERHRVYNSLAMVEEKYVLIGDPRIPDTGNLWGIRTGRTPEEAQAKFEAFIKGWYHTPVDFHSRRMQDDRQRRIAEKDFAVELF